MVVKQHFGRRGWGRSRRRNAGNIGRGRERRIIWNTAHLPERQVDQE